MEKTTTTITINGTNTLLLNYDT